MQSGIVCDEGHRKEDCVYWKHGSIMDASVSPPCGPQTCVPVRLKYETLLFLQLYGAHPVPNVEFLLNSIYGRPFAVLDYETHNCC